MTLLSSEKTTIMKKIIATTALLFVVTLTANAQYKRTETAAARTKDQVAELHKLVKLNESQNTQIFYILEEKNNTLEIKDLSDERKKALSRSIEANMKHALTPDQIEKLEKNPEFLNKLTH